MLKLVIDAQEVFDEATEEFGYVGGFEVELEHSLISMSKWESREGKPFLAKEGKTKDEILRYVRDMIISPICPDNVIDLFSPEDLDKVTSYIESPQSATTFGQMPKGHGRTETITTELIYYWMVAFNIPFECETWHLNRLFSLIRICNIKQQKPKKMNQRELAAQRAKLNAERRARLGTSG